jgi:eukaryotic-like serine/threonine-protein kinase
MDATDELPSLGTGAAGGLVLGRYRLLERLGTGGFGTVHAARDERLDRDVAVKVIPAGTAAPERAQREALAAARLEHPAVVAVFDAGEDEGARYLVSELVRGEPLDRLLDAGRLSDRDVLAVGLALADALAHAHARGVVHRDVKPQNVLVPDRPAGAVAKLADFGVAHLAGDEPLTRTGDVVGTLAYMAPEQADGARVDARADLYSLGLVLYEALAGVQPVRAGSPAATLRRIGTVLPGLGRLRRDLPQELTAAIDRAVRPRPEERGTLEDLAAALEAALPAASGEGGTILAHPLEGGPAPVAPAWLRRAGAGLLAGGLLAAALAAAGAGPLAWAPPALAAGAIGAAAVALLPRAGWLAAAAVALAALATARPAAALLALAAALPVPLLLRRTGTAWSVPALAPLLGLLGLSGAFPALAARARRPLTRAALGALGAWWLLLAEPALRRALASGAPSAGPRGAGDVLRDVLPALLTGPAGPVAAAWAAAALVAPWLVRGRSLALDAAAAALWAAALAAATAAALPRGALPGALAAGALALALRPEAARNTVRHDG